MRVTVDLALCQGHGFCYGEFPDLFEADEDGHAIVAGDPTVEGDRRERAERAVRMCPESAISLTE
jgi:ferredoxin